MTVREELYRQIKARLGLIGINGDGELFICGNDADTDANNDADAGANNDADADANNDADADANNAAIKHVDLWNHNVEFIEQETAWERPAVFIEFEPIMWSPIVHGVEYRAEVGINLHVVTDWNGGAGIGDFRLLEEIHKVLAGMDGKTFADLDIASSLTNHNHEDVVENIERYTCVGFRRLQ